MPQGHIRASGGQTGAAMFNMNNKKRTQRISAVIVILLVIAMVASTVTYFAY